MYAYTHRDLLLLISTESGSLKVNLICMQNQWWESVTIGSWKNLEWKISMLVSDEYILGHNFNIGFHCTWNNPIVPQSCFPTSWSLTSEARFEVSLCHQFAFSLHNVFRGFRYLLVRLVWILTHSTMIKTGITCGGVWGSATSLSDIKENVWIMVTLALLCNITTILSSVGIFWF